MVYPSPACCGSGSRIYQREWNYFGRLLGTVRLPKKKKGEIIDLLTEEFEDEARYSNLKNPVATTWPIPFQQIQQRDDLAADYLYFMACIDHKDIPQLLLPHGPLQKREMDAIGKLGAYSFITWRAEDLAIDLHRLVHLSFEIRENLPSGLGRL
jgi:hypothetical protein